MPVLEIDLHLIDLTYTHTRVLDAKSVSAMMRSLDQFGQIDPVTLIPNSERYTLIDGYIRVTALTKLKGRDTVLAQVLDGQEPEALLCLLARDERRSFHQLEQAALILELTTTFGLSLTRIAKDLGKDKSWVKRRLDLLHCLSDQILDLVRAGHVSTWSATRILVPLARANPAHAQQLAQYLAVSSLSTRQLQVFFQAYKTATRKSREHMIQSPELFFQVHQHKKDQAALQGPEKIWLRDMKLVCAVLTRLLPETQTLFASLGSSSARFQELLNHAEQLMADLGSNARQGLDHAHATAARNHTADAPQGDRHQGDHQASRAEPQHCAQSAQG